MPGGLVERPVAVPQLKPGWAYQANWQLVEVLLQAVQLGLVSGAQETPLQFI